MTRTSETQTRLDSAHDEFTFHTATEPQAFLLPLDVSRSGAVETADALASDERSPDWPP